MTRYAPILFAALLAAPAPAAPSSAQPAAAAAADTIPDTPAGRRLVEVVRILNQNDPGVIRGYVSESLGGPLAEEIPVDEHVRIWGEIAADTGGLVVVDIEPTDSSALRARTRTTTGETLTLHLRVEPEPPHRILGLGLTVPSPADGVARGTVPDRDLSDAEIADSLGAYLERLVDADAFSGVVLLTGADGEIVFHEAYGEADRAWGIANRKDTKFNLGSMNKMFTAVSIGRLVDDGVLAWDDPVGKWLDETWVRPEVGERVQLRHLLSHTSGLGSYFGPEFMGASRRDFKTLEDYAPIVREETLAFEPGTDRAYSNTGFLLLGAVIEAATGGSYYDYVRENVYEPAGMTDTDSYDLEYPVENLAHGYHPERSDAGTRYRDNLFEHVVKGGPAGGGYSTAPDLLAFARALEENRLVSPETTRILTTAKPELSSPGYGYGFGIEEDGTFGHTGGFTGISSALEIDRGTGRVAIVLSNYSRAMGPVMERIEALTATGR